MAVRGCIEHYNAACAGGAWDVDDVTARVSAVKEGVYQRLTKAGISAFAGVEAVLSELRARGVPYGLGSSGSPAKIKHNLR